jgi:pSer/pThr/pTyr-binding forkhead associated (FHA) protein
VEHLTTTNSRLGRKEYRLAGPVQVELRYAPDVADSQARILSRVEHEPDSVEGSVPRVTQDSEKEYAFLELLNGQQRWLLYPGDNTIGRDESCDVYLDAPAIQEKRLVSAQHATIRITEGHSLLLDGSPSGKPSANGTYVNAQRVSASGALLKDGDTIILAATSPSYPRVDTLGVAAFRYRKLRLNPNQPRKRFD